MNWQQPAGRAPLGTQLDLDTPRDGGGDESVLGRWCFLETAQVTGCTLKEFVRPGAPWKAA